MGPVSVIIYTFLLTQGVGAVLVKMTSVKEETDWGKVRRGKEVYICVLEFLSFHFQVLHVCITPFKCQNAKGREDSLAEQLLKRRLNIRPRLTKSYVEMESEVRKW